jgi:hypothetical protein
MSAIFSKNIQVSEFRFAFFVFIGFIFLSFGIFAFAEDNSVSSHNIFQDVDQDGLSNEEEKLYGTDPNKVDTDGDGYSDGVEVQGGYDPLKPAPGDRIIPEAPQSSDNSSSETNSETTTETNLTQELSSQIVEMLENTDSEDQQISLNDISQTIQDTLNQKITLSDLPEIDPKSIKIRKQKYDKLSKEEQEARIKQDTLEYITAVAYVLVSNSPTPLRSENDLETLFSSLTTQTVSALSDQNTSSVDNIIEKGLQSIEQLKAIEVPENMVETHIKALKIAQYSTTLKQDIKPRPNDPLTTIAVLSRVQGLLGMTSDFATELEQTLQQHNINAEDLSLGF